MTESRQYLLLDVGGQSVRAQVRDAFGRVVANARRKLSTFDDGAGRVTLDAEQVLAATRAVMDEVAARREISPADTIAAGLSVQRGSVVCWDRQDGRALSPVFSWRDRRGWVAAEDRDPHLAERIRRITGLRHSPYGGAGKLRWSLEELDTVRRARDADRLAAGPLGSFLVHRLLRETPFSVDDSLAQRSLLWSWRECDWSPALLESFGIPGSILPRVHPSGNLYGHLDGAFAGVPFQYLVGDQNALARLGGEAANRSLMINAGTGAFMLRPLAHPCLAAGYQTSFLERGPEGGRFALEASIHGAASAFHWLGEYEGRPFRPESLQHLRARCPRPVLFVNSVDGLGSPWWESGPDPHFVGEGAADARLLAVVESVAFLMRCNLVGIEAASGPVDAIRLSGGLSRSSEFRGLLADLVQRPVHCLEEVEGSLVGLWCALADQPPPKDAWSVVAPTPAPDLEQRYREWCAIMPPLPDPDAAPLSDELSRYGTRQ